MALALPILLQAISLMSATPVCDHVQHAISLREGTQTATITTNISKQNNIAQTKDRVEVELKITSSTSPEEKRTFHAESCPAAIHAAELITKLFMDTWRTEVRVAEDEQEIDIKSTLDKTLAPLDPESLGLSIEQTNEKVTPLGFQLMFKVSSDANTLSTAAVGLGARVALIIRKIDIFADFDFFFPATLQVQGRVEGAQFQMLGGGLGAGIVLVDTGNYRIRPGLSFRLESLDVSGINVREAVDMSSVRTLFSFECGTEAFVTQKLSLVLVPSMILESKENLFFVSSAGEVLRSNPLSFRAFFGPALHF